MTNIDPDTLLRRKPLSEALTTAGFPTAPATLATKASRGGGPPYGLVGRRPLYRWGDALHWARGRLAHCGTPRPKVFQGARHACSGRTQEVGLMTMGSCG